ncbi:MAG: hypothetical protein V4510_13040 [bacterium]
MRDLNAKWGADPPTREDIVRTRLANAAEVIAAVAEHPQTAEWDGALSAMENLADHLTHLLFSRTPGGMYPDAHLESDWGKRLGEIVGPNPPKAWPNAD